MAISSRAQLKSAVESFMLDRDLSAVFGTVLGLAEDRLFRDTRVLKWLEAAADVTISAQTAELPTDFGGVRRLYLNYSYGPELTYLTPSAFWSKAPSFAPASVPNCYTIEAGNIVVGPAPDATYTGKLVYYQRLDRLAADADTNALLTAHAGAYLYACLVEARGYVGDDPRMLTWATMLDDTLDSLDLARKLRNTPDVTAMISEVAVI